MEEQKPDMEGARRVERMKWVLNSPEPPSLVEELVSSMKETLSVTPCGTKISSSSHKAPRARSVAVFSVLKALFPVLGWARNYKLSKFKRDLMAGLTLASLSIPQSIGYASLAKLAPQYGLSSTLNPLGSVFGNREHLLQVVFGSCFWEIFQKTGSQYLENEDDTSVIPPLIYALMGSSREIAIGPVAVVSLLLASFVQKLEDPIANPIAYRKIAFTVTFFAGVFQASFGLFRLGFLVDFLSHASVVGFMGGAAIVIGLQQLKSLLGLSHFTNKTDVVSVLQAVIKSLHRPWYPWNFVLGCSFLVFILVARFIGRRNKRLFWIPAMAPLISVVLSTLIVYLTKADKHGVNIIKHLKGGLNPGSAHQLQLKSPHVGEAAKAGLICAIIALTEAIAVGRSFAAIRGYNIDGNKEMIAMGFMNVVGSLTSCYVATGSFSRTAVNFSAGCESAISNVVMAVTVLLSLELLTRLLYYTPVAILASIILSALPSLIDINEAYHIWKVDKVDFLACIGAFFGVLFASVEIGILVAVAISLGKIILNSIRPRTELLGRLPETDIFCEINHYPMAVRIPGILIIRLNSGLLCFANANFIRERIMRWVVEEDGTQGVESGRVHVVILDMSNVMNIDTSGIQALEELHKKLMATETQLAIANPRWHAIHKLKVAKFVDKIGGGWIFLSVSEAVEACFGSKAMGPYSGGREEL